MERLTTDRDYLVDKAEYERHLAQGYPRSTPSERFLKLCEYERTGHTPEEIAEFDRMYYAKCEEVNQPRSELERLKRKSSGAQGDLISRSALIQQLREEGRLTYLIKGAIDNQPTAYDADKVVEQLKNMKDLHEGLSKAEKLSKEDKYIHTLCHGLCVKVIDIVRAGGKE